jgi:uncharacterized protein YggE
MEVYRMNRTKLLGVLAGLAALSLLLAACGGDDDGPDEDVMPMIRTEKGLAVAAVGSGFDPRLQGGEADAETARQAGMQPAAAPVPGFADTDMATDSVGRLSMGYAPALQQGGDGITVQGYGTASADADSAVAEFYFFSGGGVEPVPAPDGTTSRGNSGAGSAPGSEPDIDLQQQEVPPITEASLQPVIDALTGAGVQRDDIEFIGQSYFDKFSASAALRATIGDLNTLDPAVQAATNAAANLGGIQLQSTNISYTVSDCTALEQAAMQAAVEDAGDRAAVFAQTLGVGLGTVTGASHYSYSPYGGTACGESIAGPYPLGGIPYAESGSRTVQVFANISVTYAIG